MIYRPLGRTGLQVSALAFGGSALGGVFGAIGSEAATAAVHAALDCGINVFDTAPYYGATRAETELGRALRGVARDRFILATKVGRYGPDVADFAYSAARVGRSVDESLRRLGVDQIDLIQMHDIEFGRREQLLAETLPALIRACEAGKARFIGVSGYHLHLLAGMLTEARIALVQSYCHFTLLDTTLEEWLPAFGERGVGVFNAAPLAMGLLTDQGPPEWHPAPAAVRRAAAEAALFCRARGASLASLALQFSVSEPRVQCTVVSATSAEQVNENVRAAERPPDPELLSAVQAMLSPVHNRTWPSGLPENQPVHA